VIKFLASMLILVTVGAGAQQAGSTFEPRYPALNNDYPLTADSLLRADVPQGSKFSFQISESHSYPHTERTITVYVPAEYSPERPACVFVFLDGIGFHAETVFDNLIAAHQMPITIAIGVAPGSVSAPNGDPKAARHDRSFEFDNRTPQLADFILDEVLPAVESHAAPDGRAIRLSNKADDRAIAGSSTGGMAAFNAAWQRPDAFHRVFTSIGTFVGMRGGEQMYIQVRKTEPKPIRIFMTDGANDGWPGGLEMGDWFMSNLTLERALSYAGYDVRHVWGEGSHNGSLAAQTFPEAVRWLFRDYPEPVTAHPANNQALKPVLIDGEPWKLVQASCPGGHPLAAGPDGSVYIGEAELLDSKSCQNTMKVSGLALGANGVSFAADEDGKGITRRTPGRSPEHFPQTNRVTALTLCADGTLFFATKPDQTGSGEIFHMDMKYPPWLSARTPIGFLPRKMDPISATVSESRQMAR
jgi:gluconolactonase